jgi:hypothetical protein
MVNDAVHELLLGALVASQDPEFDARGLSVGMQSFGVVVVSLWGHRIRKIFGVPEPEITRMTRSERWTLIGTGIVLAIALALISVFWGPEYPITLVVGFTAAVTISVGCLVLRKKSPKEEK